MSWYSRARNLLRSNRVSTDIDREMSFHVSERADALVGEGMRPDEAAREAQRRFGHRSALQEKTRDVDMLTWLESLMSDLRQATRVLRASPGFTTVAVVSLALGIGANTAIFSLINAVMVRSLPVENPEQLVTVAGKSYGTELNYPLWEAIRDAQTGFASAMVFNAASFNLANGGEVRRVRGNWVSGEYFTTLGVQPAAGRLFTRSDDTKGCAPTAILGYGFWQSEYGGSPSAIGKTISLSGNSYQVIGVAPRGFFGAEVGQNTQVYAPLCSMGVIATGDPDMLRHLWFLSLVARIAPNTTIPQVEANIAAALPAILEHGLGADEYQDALKDLKSFRITLSAGVGELSNLRQSYSKALYVLMTVVGIVLLIGCANVANLLLARAAAREREIAVRFALGASRMRVIRQLLTETMLLTSMGAVAGVVFAKWSSSLLVQLLSSGRNQVGLDIPIDGRVLLFTSAVSIVTGLLFGVAPAWRATRTNPQEAMRANARGIAPGGSRFTAGKMLVVGQVALSLVLVVGAGLLLGTFNRLSSMNPGFVSENVLLVRADMQKAGFSKEQLPLTTDELLQRIRAVPGVTAASASSLTPISGSAWNSFISVAGYTPKSKKDAMVYLNEVSDNFFTTLKTRIIAGRTFSVQDQRGTQKVALINQTTATKFFGTGNPVGKQLRMPGPRQKPDEGDVIEVIGVVEDAKYSSLKEEPRAVAYLSINQSTEDNSNVNYEIRTIGNPASVISAVTSLAAEINPRISLEYKKLDDQVASSLTRERLLATLSAFFGVLALLLAMIGLYGTMSYGVSRRRNEIGIRLALGAERAKVLRMVLGEVARMLSIGLVIGVACAMATSKYVASFLFGVKPNDVMTLVLSVAVLAIVALMAGAIPAWRAARLDPMLALRED
ncbi:MAG: ABC transporter permease [Gemmatimonadaceae bacterium]